MKGSQKITILFLLFLCGFLSVLTAQEKDTSIYEISGRHYYRYIVKSGNTLYSISRLYEISVPEIEEHNPQAKSGLSVGDTLYIPAAEKDKITMEKKMEVDGNFIIHEVQKKQTLYAISKIYGINIADIIAANPELKVGLTEGQFIKIPVSKLKEEEVKPEKQAVVEDKVITHEVKAKETLYSLSKTYSVSAEAIKNSNNGLPGGLKIGQVIVIPNSDDSYIPGDSTIKKDVYQVVYILPFFLDMNDTLMAHLKIDEKEKLFPKSIISVQFYQGCLMALDSLKKQGLRYHIKFYDSARDSNVVEKLMSDGELKDVDLIIGPFYLTEFLRVSEYARDHNIHIVCPVPQNNKILLGNPYVSKVATSRNILFKNLGRYAAYLFKTENIILVGQNFRASPLGLAFKTEFLNTLEKGGDTVSVKNLHEVKWDKGSTESIISLLKENVFNVIVVPSDDQVYVSELLGRLNTIHKKYMFKVIGIDLWLRYNNIDYEYFENLGVMMPVDGNIDYSRPEVKAFTKKFHTKNGIFPEKFSFQGFDITYYYLKQLHEHGNRIDEGLQESNQRLLYYKFNYFKTGIESGFENNSTILLKHENFKLEEVPVPE